MAWTRSAASITAYSSSPATPQARNTRNSGKGLAQGQFQSREFLRIAKNNRRVYIQASYNPVSDRAGKVVRVVKVASDITNEKLRAAEFESKLNAVSRVQAIIEFLPSGEIVNANENFLSAGGYRLDEIKGRHHRMFVEAAYAASPEYRNSGLN